MRRGRVCILGAACAVSACGGDVVSVSRTGGSLDAGDGAAAREEGADASHAGASTGGAGGDGASGGRQGVGGEATGGGVDASTGHDAMTDGASEAGDARDATLRVDARGVFDVRRTAFEGGQDARTDASIPSDAQADSGGGDAANLPEAGQCGPDGAALPCGSNDDCCSAQVCGAFRGDPAASFCAAPFPSAGSLGTPCTGAFAANPTCFNGLCPSTTRTCSAVCSNDADCSVQAADHICAGFQVNGTPTGLCVHACSGDPACGSGQICVLRNNDTEDRLDTYCRVAPPSGTAPGTACTTGSTCDHGLCAIRGAEQFCTTPCGSAADCPAPVPECVDFTFATPVSNQTVQVGLCAPAS